MTVIIVMRGRLRDCEICRERRCDWRIWGPRNWFLRSRMTRSASYLIKKKTLNMGN